MQIANSDHLVNLYAAHQSTRNVYLMCEYCNGGSLKDYIKNKIYLTEK